MFVFDKMDRIGPELVECCEIRQEARRRGTCLTAVQYLPFESPRRYPNGARCVKVTLIPRALQRRASIRPMFRAILPVADVVDVKYVEAKAQQGFEKKLNMLVGAVEPWQEHIRIVGNQARQRTDGPLKVAKTAAATVILPAWELDSSHSRTRVEARLEPGPRTRNAVDRAPNIASLQDDPVVFCE